MEQAVVAAGDTVLEIASHVFEADKRFRLDLSYRSSSGWSLESRKPPGRKALLDATARDSPSSEIQIKGCSGVPKWHVFPL